MNCCVPEFVLEDDNSIFPSSSVRKITDSTVEDFVELLWHKGPFLRRRSPAAPHSDFALPSRTEPSASGVSSYSAANTAAATELFMEEDEMASWLDYPLGDDGGGCGSSGAVGGGCLHEKTPAAAAVAASDLAFQVPKADRRAVVDGWAASGRPPLPPEAQGKLALVTPAREPAGAAASLPLSSSRELTVVDSSMTPGLLGRGRTPESRVSSGSGRGGTGPFEHGLTSSSGVMWEGEGPVKAAARPDDRKRKAREVVDSDSHSEDAEFESSHKKEDMGRSTSKRRSRAAEVHNLSERRRRDRINEKMKALQQLIPRCNKSDKASMLDDAIEYLKSLKMQVQMMSMGCHMVPMMFPGIPQYMPPLGMGIPTGMSMGMGLGVGMEMNARTLNHPMMPFLPVMSSSHMVPTGAAPLSQRLPMQQFHAQDLAFTDQMKLQVTSQTDPASNPTCLAARSSAQIPNDTDPCQHYAGFQRSQVHPQNQAITKQGTSKSANMPEKSKTG